MSQLQKLYQSIANFKELGLQLPANLLEETSKKEEEIIESEILPILEKGISPILNQIERQLVLEIVYVPGEPLNVNLMRKRQEDEHKSFVSTQSEPSMTDRKSFTMRPHTKGPRTGLKVTFPDGTIISERYAYQTLVETIKKVGYEKVRKVDLYANRVPLVSNERDDFYDQYDIGNGVLIMTQTATKVKKNLLDAVSEKLGLSLKVEII